MVTRPWSGSIVGVAALVTVLVMASPSSSARTQARPDLSGTWMLDSSKSDPGAVAPAGRGGRGAPAGQLTITQSTADITVQRGNQTFVYTVDGTETPGPPGGETKSKITWEGDRLVVTWKREFFAGADRGYQTSTGRDVYSLNGSTLTVERTISNARGTGGSETVKSVYMKSS